jgi:non-ribosomal peptide synthetase component F
LVENSIIYSLTRIFIQHTMNTADFYVLLPCSFLYQLCRLILQSHLQSLHCGSLNIKLILLRVNFSQNPALSELILRTRETVNGAIAHSELPFARIMEELFPELYRSERNYVRGVAFTQYEKGSSPPWPGLVTERRLWARRSLFDFYMSAVDEGEDGIALNVEYDTYLFDTATIKRWLVQYNDILQQIVSAPNSHLNDFVAIPSTH